MRWRLCMHLYSYGVDLMTFYKFLLCLCDILLWVKCEAFGDAKSLNTKKEKRNKKEKKGMSIFSQQENLSSIVSFDESMHAWLHHFLIRLVGSQIFLTLFPLNAKGVPNATSLVHMFLMHLKTLHFMER
jgi:hypothetical protein